MARLCRGQARRVTQPGAADANELDCLRVDLGRAGAATRAALPARLDHAEHRQPGGDSEAVVVCCLLHAEQLADQACVRQHGC